MLEIEGKPYCAHIVDVTRLLLIDDQHSQQIQSTSSARNRIQTFYEDMEEEKEGTNYSSWEPRILLIHHRRFMGHQSSADRSGNASGWLTSAQPVQPLMESPPPTQYSCPTTFKNRKVWSKIKVSFRMVSASMNHCLSCCGTKTSKLHCTEAI